MIYHHSPSRLSASQSIQTQGTPPGRKHHQTASMNYPPFGRPPVDMLSPSFHPQSLAAEAHPGARRSLQPRENYPYSANTSPDSSRAASPLVASSPQRHHHHHLPANTSIKDMLFSRNLNHQSDIMDMRDSRSPSTIGTLQPDIMRDSRSPSTMGTLQPIMNPTFPNMSGFGYDFRTLNNGIAYNAATLNTRPSASSGKVSPSTCVPNIISSTAVLSNDTAHNAATLVTRPSVSSGRVSPSTCAPNIISSTSVLKSDTAYNAATLITRGRLSAAPRKESTSTCAPNTFSSTAVLSTRPVSHIGQVDDTRSRSPYESASEINRSQGTSALTTNSHGLDTSPGAHEPNKSFETFNRNPNADELDTTTQSSSQQPSESDESGSMFSWWTTYTSTPGLFMDISSLTNNFNPPPPTHLTMEQKVQRTRNGVFTFQGHAEENNLYKSMSSPLKQRDLASPVPYPSLPGIPSTAASTTPVKSKARQKNVLSCECPNCEEAERLGLDGNQKKRQHNCHFPGCEKVYSNVKHLKAHLCWHTGERPFVCTWQTCGKCFTRPDELKRHMRTHTGEKRYVCDICSKSFARSDHLNNHIRTHEGVPRNSRSVSSSKAGHTEVESLGPFTPPKRKRLATDIPTETTPKSNKRQKTCDLGVVSNSPSP